MGRKTRKDAYIPTPDEIARECRRIRESRMPREERQGLVSATSMDDDVSAERLDNEEED